MVHANRLRLGMSLAFLLLFVGAAVTALQFPVLARYLPLFACAVGLLGAAGEGIQALVRAREPPMPAEQAPSVDPASSSWRACRIVAWLLGYVLAIWSVGFLIASTAFLIGFLWLESSLRKAYVVVVALGVMGALSGLGMLVGLRWP